MLHVSTIKSHNQERNYKNIKNRW